VFPEWSDFSVAGFGNILLEMYSFVGDVFTHYLYGQARESRLFDSSAPTPCLDLILRGQGRPFPFDLDALGKRRLAAVRVEMYQ